MDTTVSTGALRQRLAATLRRARDEKDRIRVERNGEVVAAIVPIEDLEALEALEDAADIRAAEEAFAEGGFRPFEEVVAEIEAEERAAGQTDAGE